MLKGWRQAAAALVLLAASADHAIPHGAGRGFVLLLPGRHVALGGALAVAVSFVFVTLLPDASLRRAFSAEVSLFSLPARAPVLSLISALILCVLIASGFLGSPDPLANPLPLAVWTVWWVGLVLLHAVLGNLWAWLNPFVGPYVLIDHFSGGRLAAGRLPESWLPAYVPAFLLFLAFAWFQLISPAPDDPASLATAVSLYAVLTLLAVCLFGPEAWLAKADPFAIFLRLVSATAPLQTRSSASGRKPMALGLPGRRLAAYPALPLAGTFFVLLTLSSISFDALSSTFRWLAFAGVNPLDFPGRSALIGFNSLGLIGSFFFLVLLYAGAVYLGLRLAGEPIAYGALFGRLVLSLIPISVAFHLAHYLADLLVNGQYAALVLNDPLRRGWNLFGLGGWQVTASFLNTASGTLIIFSIQTATIVLGHIAGVAVAHMLVLATGARRPILLEAPLATLMVAYTAFGLWLLSTPAIG